jgi:hypothetical protein
MKKNRAWVFVFCLMLGSVGKSFSETSSMPVSRLLCEGYDARGAFAFWYDVDLSQDQAVSRFSRQYEGQDLEMCEPLTSFVKDGKFSVESPYSDLQARMVLESDHWVLDLMEANGDFVIPSYDVFECERH